MKWTRIISFGVATLLLLSAWAKVASIDDTVASLAQSRIVPSGLESSLTIVIVAVEAILGAMSSPSLVQE